MENQQELTDREAQILHAVVHTYITTAEPVGSRTLSKHSGFDLSAATIRNVMADLEESGYLQQLHTSSGRIPTDKGYRYYVNHLMRVQDLTLSERSQIEQEFRERISDADQVLRQTSHLLALVSHQAGIAEIPAESSTLVRQIELLPLGERRLVVLIVDNFGRARSMQVELENPLSASELPTLTRFLNEHLRNVEIDHLGSAVENKLRTFFDEQRQLAERALQVLQLLPPTRQGLLYLEGATQLFEQPEFRDITRARQVFGLLEEQERVVELLRRAVSENKPVLGSVVIGGDGENGTLQGISVIAAPYEVNGQPVGVIGVLGPQRMHYSRLTSLVHHTSSMVGRILTRLAG